MVDNTSQGGLDLIHTDEITLLNGTVVSDGAKVQRIKAGFGADGTLQDVTESVGLPVVAKPFVALGHYQYVGVTGAIAAGAAADAEIFQLRWVDATRLFVLEQLKIDFLYATTGFAAGLGTLRATVARSWSADGGGGNALTLTGAKLRGSMGASLFSTGARIATTAALTAGTKTFDATDFGQYRDAIAVTTNANLLSQKPVQLFDPSSADGEYPLVLVQNEGVVVRATVPGTGVWIAGITAKWAEVAAY
jgi:hypothetical protein